MVRFLFALSVLYALGAHVADHRQTILGWGVVGGVAFALFGALTMRRTEAL